MNNLLKYFVILFSTALFIISANSQSIYEYGIKFTDDNNATLVGADGAVLRTTDGGYSWNQQNSYTTNVLYCLDYLDDHSVGIIVGENGMILRTTDDGNDWNIIQSNTLQHLRGVCAIELSNTFVICGDNGTILVSTDAGLDFQPGNSNYVQNLYCVSFSRDVGAVTVCVRTGLAVGDDGSILLSRDNGMTWIQAALPQHAPAYYNLRSCSWADLNNASVVGDNSTIYNTGDDGNTWSFSTYNSDINLKGIKYLGNSIAIAVGDSGTIIRSKDYGNTWVSSQSGTLLSINSVNFADNFVGISVGEANTTLLTNDGGLTWNTIPQAKMKKNIAKTSSVKKDFVVKQNYPNPFNPSTQINYELPFDSKVFLKVYDMVGREVANLVNSIQHAGNYSVTFNGNNLASGVYFYKLYALSGSREYVKTMRMILAK